MATDQAKLQFQFDQETFEVTLNVSGNPEREKLVSFKLGAPTAAQELERERSSYTEIIDRGKDGEKYESHKEEASGNLFDKICQFVKGVRLKGEPPEVGESYREATPDLLSRIPADWKTKVIDGLHVGECEVQDLEDDVILGDDLTTTVNFYFPNKDDAQFTMTFEVPTPTERERTKFTDEVLKYVAGRTRKQASRMSFNLQSSVDFFDNLMKRPGAGIVGGTVGGRTFFEASDPIAKQAFLDAINPTIKARVVGTAINKFNARLQD